jgi:long-subunit acyl-CoA synthetase (AMP-forming)
MSLLREWAEQRGVASKNLVEAPAVKELLAEELARVSRQIEVKYQRVRRAVLIAEEPSLTNGELTPSGKVVRRAVMDHHAEKIAKLFATRPDDDVIEVVEPELQKARSA